MNSIEPTALERSLIAMFYELYRSEGFPSPADICITLRENTLCGRYLALASSTPSELPDGHYDLGGNFIEIPGVEHGLMAVARAADGKPVEIEIVAYGGESWDGTESTWTIVQSSAA